jgi:hypothetical protein
MTKKCVVYPYPQGACCKELIAGGPITYRPTMAYSFPTFPAGIRSLVVCIGIKLSLFTYGRRWHNATTVVSSNSSGRLSPEIYTKAASLFPLSDY